MGKVLYHLLCFLMIMHTKVYIIIFFVFALFNMLWGLETANIWIDGIVLGSGVINMIIFIVLILVFWYIEQNEKCETIMTQIRSENNTLQTRLTDKNSEIANLQRQLANGRTGREPGRIENSLPPYTEQENERGRLLTINRLPDYQTIQ